MIIIKHIERILCGTSVEFLHSTLWNIRSIVWNMEFHNVELVWNYEFHINEKFQKSSNTQVSMIIAAPCA